MGWTPGDPDAADRGDALGNPDQLKAPQGGARIPTPENPIYYSGHAALTTRADRSQGRGEETLPSVHKRSPERATVSPPRPLAPSPGPGAVRGPASRPCRLGPPGAAAPPAAAGKGAWRFRKDLCVSGKAPLRLARRSQRQPSARAPAPNGRGRAPTTGAWARAPAGEEWGVGRGSGQGGGGAPPSAPAPEALTGPGKPAARARWLGGGDP